MLRVGLLLGLAWGVSVQLLAPAAAGEAGGLSPDRHRAAVVALLCPGFGERAGSLAAREMADYRQAVRPALGRLCQSLVQEGGFLRPQAASCLGQSAGVDGTLRRVFASYDQFSPVRPSANAKKDPAETDLAAFWSPILGVSLALGYYLPDENSWRGAQQAAELADPSPYAGPCARAVCGLMQALLTGESRAEVLLEKAATAAGQPRVAQAVRGAPLRHWDELREKDTVLGGLERVLHIWVRLGEDPQALRQARDALAVCGEKHLLDIMCATRGGWAELAEDFASPALREPEISELCRDLFSLAGDRVLLDIPAYEPGSETRLASRTRNGQPLPESAPAAPTEWGTKFTLKPTESRNAETLPAPPRSITQASANGDREFPDVDPLAPLPALPPLP